MPFHIKKSLQALLKSAKPGIQKLPTKGVVPVVRSRRASPLAASISRLLLADKPDTRKLIFEPLEPRLLLSADIMPVSPAQTDGSEPEAPITLTPALTAPLQAAAISEAAPTQTPVSR